MGSEMCIRDRVCAELFLRPILRAMLGMAPGPDLATARAAIDIEANGAREHWMRARLGHAPDGALLATPLDNQDSSLVTVFATAGALIRRASRAPAVAAGDVVDVLILDRLS